MIKHKEEKNGFKYIEIKNAKAEAKIALQGAHVFHYKKENKSSLLWLSELAFFEHGKAIRGGVPICFPWFGKHKNDATLPQHGFARTALWSLTLEEEIDDNTTHIELQLLSTKESKKVWDYDFDVRLDILVGEELSLKLMVTNRDNKAFEITTALHSYFNVSNIENIKINTLKNCNYLDALDGKEYIQKDEFVVNKEVDRVYWDASSNILLEDDLRKIELTQKGSNSLVVWNPWCEKSKSMADMSDDGYKNMICLETGNVGRDFRLLEVGESSVLGLSIRSLG